MFDIASKGEFGSKEIRGVMQVLLFAYLSIIREGGRKRGREKGMDRPARITCRKIHVCKG